MTVKKLVLVIFVLMFSLTALANGAENVIENPSTPVKSEGGKKAGRQVAMTELMRITDDGGEFLFKSPRRLDVAPDGSVFVTDQDLLLKFDANGKFQKKILKKGEGPGEVKYLSNYALEKDEIIVGAARPTKIICTDMDGKLKNEFRAGESGSSFEIFMTRYANRYYFQYQKVDFQKMKSGVQMADNVLMYADDKGKTTKLDLNFPIKQAVVKIANKGMIRIAMDYIAPFRFSVSKKKYMYVTHSERYLLKLLDLDKNKVVKEFRRQYKAVPFVPEEEEELKEGELRPSSQYKREHYNDIYQIAANGDRVWVFTSTLDKKRGVLVDVFDLEGRYVDCFYLNLPGVERPDQVEEKGFVLRGNIMYTMEKDEDDVPSIVKYKLDM